MSDGNIVNLNYRLLKERKLNGDINTALIQKVKKEEWTWIEFFKHYNEDDYVLDSKIDEEKSKEIAKKKKEENEKKKRDEKKRTKHKYDEDDDDEKDEYEFNEKDDYDYSL